MSDDKGEYSLTVKPGEYKIKAASLGNFPVEKELLVDHAVSLKVNVNFMLKPDPELLKEVVVSKDIAARVRSDTVTYTVGKYLTGNEKVLKDVLNKLPGIEVKEDGKVKAYGKDVDKIMVEGDDFFFDQQKMATENLSAEAIDQVQVLNNYQANSLQKDFSQGGQTALNINVKDEYRNRLSGNIAGGAGYQNKFLGNANLYQFGKKLKASFIANANNTGEETFSMHDYMSFGGGISQLMENSDNSGGLVQINPGNISSGVSGGNDANQKTTVLGALNLNYKPVEKLKVNSSIVISTTDRNESERLTRSFLDQNAGLIQRNSLDAARKLFMGNLNLNISYKPQATMALSYRANGGSNEVESNTGIVNEGLRSFRLNENQDISTLKISQYLDYSWKFHPKAFINFGLFHEFREKDMFEKLYSDSAILGLSSGISPSRFNQGVTTQRQQYGFNASLSYKPGKVILKAVTGVSTIDQSFSSDLRLTAEDTDFKVDGFENDLSYNIYNYRGALYLVKNKGLVQFNAGPVLQYYSAKTNVKNGFNKLLLTPDVRFTLKFSDTHSFTLSYSQRLSLPAPEELIENMYVKNYRTLATGGLKTENYSFYNQLNGHYMIFDAFSNTLFSIGAFYMKKADAVSVTSGNGVDYNTQSSAIVPFEESFGSTLYFDKKLRKIPLSLKFNTNYNKSFGFNYIQEHLNGISRTSLGSSAGILTRFNFLLNAELGVSGSWSAGKSALVNYKNVFSSIQPFAKMHLYHKSGFTGFVSFSKLDYRSDSQQKSYRVLSSTIRYQKPSSNVEFSMSVSNLLNLDDYFSFETQVTENFYLERRYSVLPGYVLFRIKYTIKGLSK
jgi:hypothetical protein